MNIESLDHHIKTLTHRHTLLEVTLEKLYKQKSWNEFEAEKLKKEKLKIKDELTKMHKKRYELMNAVDWD
jgi:hypothetical protein